MAAFTLSRSPKWFARRVLLLAMAVLAIHIATARRWRTGISDQHRKMFEKFASLLPHTPPPSLAAPTEEAGAGPEHVDETHESEGHVREAHVSSEQVGEQHVSAPPPLKEWAPELCGEGRSLQEWVQGPEPQGLEPKWRAPQMSEGVTKLIQAEERIQEEFCRVAEKCKSDLTNKGDLIEVGGLNLLGGAGYSFPVTMYVVKEPDIVSSMIMRQGVWEPEVGQQILNAMQLEVARRGKGGDVPVTFLDVGANVGWFSVLVAGAGYRVLAFEAMKRNAMALRSTLCRNPYLARRVTLFHHAIGNETKQGCFMTSHVINEGNGNVCCGDPAVVELPEDHVFREWLPDIVRLDDYLAEQAHTIAVVKMDIEGYEELAFLGGGKTLLETGIPYIVMEFAAEGLKRHGSDPLVHLRRIQDAGYVLSLTPGGPIQTPEELSTSRNIFNIWFTHRSVR